MATYRDRDMKIERVIADYLDSRLYSQKNLFAKADRTDSLPAQMSGSDIILTIPSLGVSDIIVDEKAATHYINKPLATFAFELSFLTSTGQRVEGWFTDQNKKTEYYLLMWLKASKDNPWHITGADITEIEYVLVSRQSILDFLASEGLGLSQLQQKSQQIVADGVSGVIDKSYPYYYFYTDRLQEKPVNIIIHKDKLKQLAILKGTI